MEAEGQVTEKGGTRMRKANTGIDQGEARPHLYWVQNTRQGLGQPLRFWFLLPSRDLAVCPTLRSPQLDPSALPAPSSPKEMEPSVGMGSTCCCCFLGAATGSSNQPAVPRPSPAQYILDLLGFGDSEAQLSACEENPTLALKLSKNQALGAGRSGERLLAPVPQRSPALQALHAVESCRLWGEAGLNVS